MRRSMNLNCIWAPTFESIDRGSPCMRRTVVRNPKHPSRRSIRFLAHHQIDQCTKAVDDGTAAAQPIDFGASDTPGHHVSQSPFALIFVLNTAVASEPGRHGGNQAAPGLDAGFFATRDNKVITTQRLSFPEPMIQIQNSGGPLFKIKITRPNPAAVAPGPDRILAHPAPDGFNPKRDRNV